MADVGTVDPRLGTPEQIYTVTTLSDARSLSLISSEDRLRDTHRSIYVLNLPIICHPHLAILDLQPYIEPCATFKIHHKSCLHSMCPLLPLYESSLSLLDCCTSKEGIVPF